jgi:FKBP-type peptidyl-prolyl cis-trans isomerase SlyD
VTAVTDELVTVDGNHPLAGKNLTFEVSIEDIRDATAEELEQGHILDASEPTG